MSKLIPILFSTAMAQAILSGNKTVTRRVIKTKFSNTDITWKELHSGKTRILVEMQNDVPPPVKTQTGHIYKVKGYAEIKYPYAVGDILWVRETHARIIGNDGIPYYSYKQEDPLKGEFVEDWQGWTPSIFMPRDACRIFLKIKSVRVERLNEMNGDDVQAEGILNDKSNKKMGIRWHNIQVMEFQKLWDNLNGKKYPWNNNPFVWVIEFEKCEKPKGFN